MSWKPSVPMDDPVPGVADFVKWDDGEIKELVILNDQPITYTLHWISGQPEPCKGPGCGACQMGIRPSRRYVVWVQTGNDQLLWEMAMLTWRDLATIAEMQGALRGLHLRVKRTGTGRDTRYTLVPIGLVGESELPDEPELSLDLVQPTSGSGNGNSTSDFTNLGAVRADPRGAAAYLKSLCQSLGTTPLGFTAQVAERYGKKWAELGAPGRLHTAIIEAEKALMATDTSTATGGDDWDLEELLG